MKRNFFLLTLGLVLLMFTQVHATLLWQGDYYNFGYNVYNPEAGSFFVPPTTLIGDIGVNERKSPDGGNDFDSVVRLTNLVPTNQGHPPTAVIFTAGANGPNGGTNPENGVQAQGYLTVNFENFNESNHGLGYAKQDVNSWVVRNIMLDEDGTYDLNANFDGLLNYNNMNFDTSGPQHDVPYHTLYHYDALVWLQGYTRPNSWTWVSFGEPTLLTWDETTGDLHEMVTLFSQDEDGNDVTYQLKVLLNIESDLCNCHLTSITDPTGLPEFQNALLGTENDPLTVTATLTPSQTPVKEPPAEQNVAFCDDECQATAPIQVSSGQTDIGFYYTRPVNILAGVISEDFVSVWWLTPDCKLKEAFYRAATNISSLSCPDVALPEAGSNGWIFWLVSESDLGSLDWENGIYELLFYQI